MVRRLLAGAALVGCIAAAPATLAYPPTPVHTVVDHYFGTAVSDPYRWLENGSAPAVKAWARRQSMLAISYLRSRPAYPAYAKRVAALSRTSTARFALRIAGGHYIYLRHTPPQPQPALVVRDGLHGAERVLFDPQRVAGAGAPPAIESIYASFDGSKVAFTTQQGGREEETLHVVDTATGTLLPDVIPHAGGGFAPVALVWDADGSGFLHTRWPQKSDGTYADSHIELWHHTLGTAASDDTYVFGRGLSGRAEYSGLLGSRDGKYQAAVVTDGDGVFASVYERAAGGTFTQVASPADGIGSSDDAQSTFLGDRLLVVSSRGGGRGAVVAIDPGGTFASGTTLVPAGPRVVEDVVAAKDGFLTLGNDGGDSVVTYVAGSGGSVTVPLPAQSTLTAAATDKDSGDIVLGYVGYGTTNRWFSYDPAANALAPTGIAETAPGDYSQLVVRRAFVPSLDGRVKVPLEIVSLRGAKTDGTAPTILYAYGAYGEVTRPFFAGSILAFLERGGVFAQAMIRGGGEYGEPWHLAAKLQTKTKSADDVAAAAAWLGTHGYGNARHLGIWGGSAGGFLMGLALTRNPELYRAVVSEVGFYDLLREERTPNGAYNTPEFGTVTDPKQFAWMLKQSPYQNVVKGRAYPAILMTTGENDPRVDPYNSRKMIARLQAATSSSAPILLWQRAGQGHGIGNSFEQQVDQTTAVLTFFDSQLR
jgi:prolyl oligopeptidase